jgi:mono/diheme cytochrome c family protein
MKMVHKLSAATVAVVFSLTQAARAVDGGNPASANSLPPASTKTGVTYATDIQPIFQTACFNCHDSRKPKQGGKLSLDTLAGALKGGEDGKVVTPDDSAHSDLVLAISHVGDPDGFMPRGRGAKKLTDDQIGLIRAWIDQGAK